MVQWLVPDFCVFFHLKFFSGSLQVTLKVSTDKLCHYAAMPSSRISKATKNSNRREVLPRSIPTCDFMTVNHVQPQDLSHKDAVSFDLPCPQSSKISSFSRRVAMCTPKKHHPTIITMMFQSMMLCPLLGSQLPSFVSSLSLFHPSPQPTWPDLTGLLSCFGGTPSCRTSEHS